VTAAPLVLTPGDPLGIGPEIALKALAGRGGADRRVVLFGAADALSRAAKVVPGAPELRVCRTAAEALAGPGPCVWDPGDASEPVEVASIRAAVAACLRGDASGLVTGPIHKARLAARGFEYPGHTGFLAHLCGVERPVMAFVGGRLRVALVTVHLPLRAVADALTIDGVLHVLRTTDRALREQLGVKHPRLVVCGLNPHAGDSGLLGTEEVDIIAPAVAAASAHGVLAHGPISAEAAFRQAADGAADLVVAMYHDQGLAPLKLVDFGESVNWTLGLPIVRTSVDHGTADDIAGRGVADPRSMRAALRLAERLAR
jgi:4-hydroxythreonine-4-phosphate dehydrogenase